MSILGIPELASVARLLCWPAYHLGCPGFGLRECCWIDQVSIPSILDLSCGTTLPSRPLVHLGLDLQCWAARSTGCPRLGLQIQANELTNCLSEASWTWPQKPGSQANQLSILGVLELASSVRLQCQIAIFPRLPRHPTLGLELWTFGSTSCPSWNPGLGLRCLFPGWPAVILVHPRLGLMC